MRRLALASACLAACGGSRAGLRDAGRTEAGSRAHDAGRTDGGAGARDAGAPPREWVTLDAPGGPVDALFRHPRPGERRAAVVYHHGALVEELGYAEAARKGYDVADFVDALAEAGYAALAPVRPAGSRLRDGIAEAALAFLRAREDVDAGRVHLLGFSRGAVFALAAAAADEPGPPALVLMSPAFAAEDEPWSSDGEMDEYFGRLGVDLAAVDSAILVTAGVGDSETIRVNAVDFFVPRMRTLGSEVEVRADYPGDHAWFRRVREQYWPDVVGFFERH